MKIQVTFAASVPRERIMADARLIAAAPDLLSAAQEAMEALEDHITNDSKHYGIPPDEVCPCRCATLPKLNAAIRKATGED